MAEALRVLEHVARQEGLTLAPTAGGRGRAPGSTIMARRCLTRRCRSASRATPSSSARSAARNGRSFRPRSSRSGRRSCRCASISRSLPTSGPGLLYRELTAASPIKSERIPDGIDIVCIRELTGGLYFGKPKETTALADGDLQAVDTMVYRKSEIERITADGHRDRALAQEAALLDRQGQRPRDLRPLAEDRDRFRREARARHRAQPHVRGQCRHAARPRTQPVRRLRHREHVRRHPLRRDGRHLRLARDALLGVARGGPQLARACPSGSTSPRAAPPPTSPARGSPIPAPRSSPRPSCSATASAWRRPPPGSRPRSGRPSPGAPAPPTSRSAAQRSAPAPWRTPSSPPL